MWTPSRAGDEADHNPRVIANRLDALIRDTNAGFVSVTQALKAFERIEAKLDVIIDRQNVTDRRVDDLERRVAQLEAAKPRRSVKR